MNDQIRELIKQAGINIDSFQFSGTPIKYIVDEPSLEKFAELIVKECISVPYAMWDQAELNADVAVKIEHRIRDHFGIEE